MSSASATRPLKVVYLTAGAGGMICGSCLRDNTLARALLELGVDVQLIPLYTPIRTDEEDVSCHRVFFGGIGLYLKHHWPWTGRIPRWLTAWLDHPWLLRRVASGRIQTDARELGALTLTMLSGDEGPLRRDVDRLCRWLARESPDVVNLSNLLIAGAIPTLKSRLGLPIVVTLQGDDLFLEQLPPPYRRQALDRLRNLAKLVDQFVVFSQFYRQKMCQLLDIPPETVVRVPLGVSCDDLARLNRGPRPDRPLTIGFLARMAPEKGLHILVDAWLQLIQRPEFAASRLAVAGWDCRPESPYVAAQMAKIRQAGVESQVVWWGEVDRAEKCRFFEAIDVLCAPVPYKDPKGLFALEALAAGVPVVLPPHGAFPELLEEVGGGWLLAAATSEATADRLAEIARSPTKLKWAGEAGRKAVLAKRTPRAMAEATLEVYHRVRHDGEARDA